MYVGKIRSQQRARMSGVGRQAARLTVAIWACTFFLFLLPTLVAKGHLPNFVLGYMVVLISAGMALSSLLYLVAARLRDARQMTKIGGIAAATLVISLFYSVLDVWMGGEILRIFMSAHRIPQEWLMMTVSNLISFFWLFGVLGMLYIILHTNQAMRENEVLLVEARSLAQTAQLTALRLQLNPHFLFNTLNAISSLIVTGRSHDGEAMIGKLSSFLRTALTTEVTGNVSLGDELEALQTYLEIEAVRFGDRLSVDFQCSEDLMECRVPSFVLQPLVENAVKHGVAPTRSPVLVEIIAESSGPDLLITVRNTGGGKAEAPLPGTGVGLANTAHRLKVLYGDRGRLSSGPIADGFAVLVRVPRYLVSGGEGC